LCIKIGNIFRAKITFKIRLYVQQSYRNGYTMSDNSCNFLNKSANKRAIYSSLNCYMLFTVQRHIHIDQAFLCFYAMIRVKPKVDSLKTVGNQCFLTLCQSTLFIYFSHHSSFLFLSSLYCCKEKKIK